MKSMTQLGYNQTTGTIDLLVLEGDIVLDAYPLTAATEVGIDNCIKCLNELREILVPKKDLVKH